MSEEISCQEVKSRLESGERINLIDVRELWEHDEENIGGTCYPLGELPSMLDQLAHLKSSEVIVHCKTGPRGNRARKYLTAQGFANVRNMTGGITAFLSLVEPQ